MRTCENCGKVINESRSKTVKFCTKSCRIEKYKSVYNPWNAARKADRGAASELMAAADLLKQGFEVYRNVSPHGSSDLIIRKGDTVLTVEVRTARRYKNGTVSCSEENRSDILAMVIDDRVLYRPDVKRS